MITKPDHRYLGYTIAIHVWPLRANRYGSSFSIHKGDDGTRAKELPLAYREGHALGMSCSTADEAHQDAIERACEWVNAHQ